MKDSEWYEELGREVSAIVGKMMYESIRTNETIETTKEEKPQILTTFKYRKKDKALVAYNAGFELRAITKDDLVKKFHENCCYTTKLDNVVDWAYKNTIDSLELENLDDKEIEPEYRIEQPTIENLKKEFPNISEKFIVCIYNYITTRQKIVNGEVGGGV